VTTLTCRGTTRPPLQSSPPTLPVPPTPVQARPRRRAAISGCRTPPSAVPARATPCTPPLHPPPLIRRPRAVEGPPSRPRPVSTILPRQLASQARSRWSTARAPAVAGAGAGRHSIRAVGSSEMHWISGRRWADCMITFTIIGYTSRKGGEECLLIPSTAMSLYPFGLEVPSCEASNMDRNGNSGDGG
jgi:hypothetical protein